ncbi:hypothetical protein MNB_SUP05-SYMBIONT-5-191 [hydrothermal vent metagenome]|uniref:Uncharacterized protein n=1 Tax=hydrothermal vent metagenome TaxID=652676 RepID=A0A1W1E1M1_9ZZZZ
MSVDRGGLFFDRGGLSVDRASLFTDRGGLIPFIKNNATPIQKQRLQR